ncbi:hypothetical protein NLM33_37590 [Bradyrhizobium sp. CCGUVB1N3]|uniref:hypothetical protein n=1 Tax=Bradyrhizobium sp. CCGUVB1N3 TaxID=2949629 RepID=UPI0020B2ED0F|nr:hypothetical protein [Bradyrhizobium sp. CCGUVB1N3]MCP3475955.1 hypothetical protein [Bradyrhizobium sp. CCGUVB1N3]
MLPETIGRYECNVFGLPDQDQIGDRNGHALISQQYTCLGTYGMLKGAVYSAMVIGEADGPQTSYFFGGGIHRTSGGLAVTQLVESKGAVMMKDGIPSGIATSGRVLVKFASGSLTALSGKTLNFSSKSTGPNRFHLEFTE